MRSLSEKVDIQNPLSPTDKDFYKLQEYLDHAERPELILTNISPSDRWREKRIRDFRLIRENASPKFKILYSNTDPEDREQCIVTYVSMNPEYEYYLERLIQNLTAINFKGHIIYRVGGLPLVDEGSLEYFDVPYSFKVLAVLEAQKLGYKNILWLDSCFIPIRSLDPLFEHLKQFGVCFFAYHNYNHKNHITDSILKTLNCTLKEFYKMSYVQSFIVGINTKSKIGSHLLDFWHKTLKEKIGFLSFIPELAPLMILVNQLGLLPFSCNKKWAASIENPTRDSLLLWDRPGDLRTIE